jgi:hypothetical protein
VSILSCVRSALLAIGLLGLLTTLSCDSYDGFELRVETTPPTDVTIDAGSVILPQGTAVGVLVLAPGAEDPETGEVYVAVRSSDPSVINVWPTVEQNTFVIYGVSEGTAVLTVLIEGEDDESIPAKVTTASTIADAGP